MYQKCAAIDKPQAVVLEENENGACGDEASSYIKGDWVCLKIKNMPCLILSIFNIQKRFMLTRKENSEKKLLTRVPIQYKSRKKWWWSEQTTRNDSSIWTTFHCLWWLRILCWYATGTTGGKNNEVQFYQSFTYDAVDYFLYDSVYVWCGDEPEPSIGKLVKMWETPSHKNRVKFVWYFHPDEIKNILGDVKPLDKEVFLACGEGKGLFTIGPPVIKYYLLS